MISGSVVMWVSTFAKFCSRANTTTAYETEVRAKVGGGADAAECGMALGAKLFARVPGHIIRVSL